MNKQALIYNNYLDTHGGGERSTLDLARSLSSLGFEITLACARRNTFSLAKLSEAFGVPEAISWNIFECDEEEEIAEHLAEKEYQLFANHTTCSFMPNTAPFGLYMAMFPFYHNAQCREALRTYDLVSCNSHFTQSYVRMRWGENLPTAVMPPPISGELLNSPGPHFSEKEKLILLVGRFNVFGHSKCQLEAIEAFIELREKQVLDSSWRMVVAGHLNPSPETEAYFENCLSLAESSGSKVSVLANLSLPELRELYREATVLWQFTGVGLPFGVEPGKCEHLGLVALDCFAFGTIPVVYQRGGMNHLLSHGLDGFSFGSSKELAIIMELISSIYGGDTHREMFERILQRRKEFSLERFTSRLQSALLANDSSRALSSNVTSKDTSLLGES